MRAFTKYAAALAIFGTVTVIHADSGTTPASPSASVADMQAGAVRLDAQMKADLNEVLQFKAMARKKQDVIKLNCVNDRLVQLKAQLNIADSTNQQLQVSLAKNSDDRQALYKQFADTAEAVKRLRAEADACIGAPDLMKQESGVEVEHPDLPDDPNGHDPFEIETEPPGYASPFN